jgi:hypothetical protein
MLPERERRLAENQTAQEMSSTTTSTLTIPRRCAEGLHAARWACPLHGCPECAGDRLAYGIDDLDTWQPPTGVPTNVEDLLMTIAEDYLEVGACEVCSEIRTRSGWAEHAGWECEQLDHLVCEDCSTCYLGGKVCRRCCLCLEHQDQSETCEVTRWDPRTEQEHLIGYSHELWNPSTGRWGG